MRARRGRLRWAAQFHSIQQWAQRVLWQLRRHSTADLSDASTWHRVHICGTARLPVSGFGPRTATIPRRATSSLRRAGLFAVGAGSTYLPAAGADRCRTSCRPDDQYHPLPARLRYPNRTVALEKRRRKIHTDRALLNIDAAALV